MSLYSHHSQWNTLSALSKAQMIHPICISQFRYNTTLSLTNRYINLLLNESSLVWPTVPKQTTHKSQRPPQGVTACLEREIHYLPDDVYKQPLFHDVHQDPLKPREPHGRALRVSCGRNSPRVDLDLSLCRGGLFACDNRRVQMHLSPHATWECCTHSTTVEILLPLKMLTQDSRWETERQTKDDSCNLLLDDSATHKVFNATDAFGFPGICLQSQRYSQLTSERAIVWRGFYWLFSF